MVVDQGLFSKLINTRMGIKPRGFFMRVVCTHANRMGPRNIGVTSAVHWHVSILNMVFNYLTMNFYRLVRALSPFLKDLTCQTTQVTWSLVSGHLINVRQYSSKRQTHSRRQIGQSVFSRRWTIKALHYTSVSKSCIWMFIYWWALYILNHKSHVYFKGYTGQRRGGQEKGNQHKKLKLATLLLPRHTLGEIGRATERTCSQVLRGWRACGNLMITNLLKLHSLSLTNKARAVDPDIPKIQRTSSGLESQTLKW